jgi:DNA adenine methylase
MPAHRKYVEPFGGAAGVLLQKSRVYAEVYNDLDGDIVNFFRVLQDPVTRAQLIERCELTPYAREEFELAYEPSDDPVERARRVAVRASMGFGSAGATKSTTGFRIDTERKCAIAMHTWARYPSSIAAVGERFAGVLIENRPAIQVMQQHDSPDCLHFVDPPYLPEVRNSYGRMYAHEMTQADHLELLSAVRELKGMVMLCGYHSEMYAAALADWQMVSTRARASTNRGTALRTECMWLNPACTASLDEQEVQRRLLV